jgi:hypothetical protein
MIGAAIKISKKTSIGEISEPAVAPGRKTMGGADCRRRTCWACKCSVDGIPPLGAVLSMILQRIHGYENARLEIFIAWYNRQLDNFPAFDDLWMLGRYVILECRRGN